LNIVLFRPSFRSVYKLFKRETKRSETRSPEGILYVASLLLEKGHNVSVVDGHLENMSFDRLVDTVAAQKPDIAGCGSTTPEFPMVSRYLESIKNRSCCLTVLGGPHATALPDSIISENPHIDYVVRGEGEYTFLELVETLNHDGDLCQAEGLAFAQNGAPVVTPARAFIDDLDQLPPPARDLVPIEKYLYPHPKEGLKPAVTMLTSRGCPFNCIFCFSMLGKKTRYRSVRLVVDELEMLKGKYDIDFFVFHDETFTVNRSRTMNMCQEIIDRHLDIDWYCFTRADALDEELIAKMSKAGCVKVSMGVESGNQQVLDRVRKNTTLEGIRKVYQWLNHYGIETRGSFILGLPGETHETIRKTVEFSKSLDLKRVAFNIATPYPGTKLYEMARKGQQIRLLSEDWGEYRRWGNAVIKTDAVSREELIQWQEKATAEFYSQRRIILYHLRKLLTTKDFAYYLRPFWFAIKKTILHYFKWLQWNQKATKRDF
jgi:anaerobic magnesium-protoporphyrin IX monomethyl ester cyclase